MGVAALVGRLRPVPGDAAAAALPGGAVGAVCRVQGGAADAGHERLRCGVVDDQLRVAGLQWLAVAGPGVAGRGVERDAGGGGQLQLVRLGLQEGRWQGVLAEAPAVADDVGVRGGCVVGHAVDHGQDLGDAVGRRVDLDAAEPGRVGHRHLDVELDLDRPIHRIAAAIDGSAVHGGVQPEAGLERCDVGGLEVGELDQRDRLTRAVVTVQDQGAVAVRGGQVTRQVAAVGVLGMGRGSAGRRHGGVRRELRPGGQAVQLGGGVQAGDRRHQRRDRGRQPHSGIRGAEHVAVCSAVGGQADVERARGGGRAAVEAEREQAGSLQVQTVPAHVGDDRGPVGAAGREQRAQLSRGHRRRAAGGAGAVGQQRGVSRLQRHGHVDRPGGGGGSNPGGSAQGRQGAARHGPQGGRDGGQGAGRGGPGAGNEHEHRERDDQRPREGGQHPSHSACSGQDCPTFAR